MKAFALPFSHGKHTNCFSLPGDGGTISPPDGRQVKSLEKIKHKFGHRSTGNILNFEDENSDKPILHSIMSRKGDKSYT